MAQIEAANVIAGIENPRILIVGPELVTNQGFEENLNDWTAGNGATITRESDTATPFGDYVMGVEDDSILANMYVDHTINFGSAIQGKKFICTLFAKRASDTNQVFKAKFENGSVESRTAFEYWKKHVYETTMPTPDASTTFFFQIYPESGDPVTSEGKIYVDHVSIREILYDIQLPLPWRNQFKHGFIPLLQSGYKLDNAVNKKFYKGLVYYYSAFWNKLTVAEEQNRNKIIMENQINGNDLIIFPHKDSDRCYLVSCENNRLEWSWMSGVAIGHEGGIELMGNELFQMAPDDVVTSSYYENIIISEDIIIT